MTRDFIPEANAMLDEMIRVRRDFHQHPELGFQEVRTAGIVATQLRDLGLEVSTGIAKTGVVALLEGDFPGPTLLLRFDMDALPITEANQTDYISTHPGVMHACGHDGHTAIGLAVAKILNGHRKELGGTLKFVFQPAEEGLGGAKKMVDEGVLQNPAPDVSLALHLWNDKPLGWVGVTEGPAMAASERFHVVLTGSGGHGASPYLTRDPIVAAAHVITALQSIPARNVNALDSAIVSVTAVESGSAFNVIPDKAILKGTIRTFTSSAREIVLRRFQEVAEGVSKAMGCEAAIELTRTTPAVSNDPEVAARVRQVVRQLAGEESLDTTERTMGSEDMAYMMDDVPGCYFFVGSANREKHLDYPHHHPRFDFDERALAKAAGLMASAAASFLLKE